MIEVNHLTYAYSRRGPAVLDGLNFTLEGGHIYGLLGKNGTGKSTLLYLLSGLLRPLTGSIRLDGTDVSRRRPETLRETYLVPEELMPLHLTAREFARLNAPFYPRFDAAVFDRCLECFDLDGDLPLDRLSMGQTKKAHMSFALATGAGLILMDEPTNGLDIPSKRLFRQAIARHLRDDQAVVISTHQVHDVESLLDHVLMLHEGHLMLDLPTETISSALRFEVRQAGEPVDDALYAQPVLGGQAVIVRGGQPGDETQLDLELLFNALESGSLRADDLV